MYSNFTRGPKAPHWMYNKPIPVLTATMCGFDPNDRWKLVMIELRNPEVAGKSMVLPGGIYSCATGTHRCLRQVANLEILQEAGLIVQPGFIPVLGAISNRADVDLREWCSFPTVNGAVDFIMVAPLVGQLAPQDQDEVRRAFWQDVREIDLSKVGRGHDLLLKLWKVICECGGLTQDLFVPENVAKIEALSNQRHVVSVGPIIPMIFLEDRIAVRDDRC